MINNYKKYIESEFWKDKRDYFLSNNPNCKICGLKATEVHHITYEHLENEPSKDLFALCMACHYDIHNDSSNALKKYLHKHFSKFNIQFKSEREMLAFIINKGL